jgi:hypothetical protein
MSKYKWALIFANPKSKNAIMMKITVGTIIDCEETLKIRAERAKKPFVMGLFLAQRLT